MKTQRSFSVMIALVLASLVPATSDAFKPKSHLYFALESIKHIQAGECVVEIQFLKHPISEEVCEAVRAYPNYFLGGVIGPDAFPDIYFGQATIHPDSRCDYDDPDHRVEGDCQRPPAEGISWSYEWFGHLLRKARQITNPSERQKAIAFTYGFLIHGAGDVWAHTLVNRFAEGSWPDSITANTIDIPLRHIVVEGIIGDRTPADTLTRVQQLGGISAPIDFIYEALIVDDWARRHSPGALTTRFLNLKDFIDNNIPEAPRVGCAVVIVFPTPVFFEKCIKRQYMKCWSRQIEKGIREWPEVSLRVARDIFISDNFGRLWDPHYSDFTRDHVRYMAGGLSDPTGMFSRCTGVPGWLLDPGRPLLRYMTEKFENVLDNFPPALLIDAIKDKIVDYMFEQTFGRSFDEVKDHLTSPERFFGRPLFGSNNVGALLDNILGVSGDDAEFALHDFAAGQNTVVLGSLALMEPEQLDQALFKYSVGPMFNEDSGLPDKMKPNVMAGYARSLDGNHQWRYRAPPLPIFEPDRRFSEGSPLWTDCLAQKNLFRNVFEDWDHFSDSPTVYAGESNCRRISALPPVTIRYDVVGTEHLTPPDERDYYLGAQCNAAALKVTMWNHRDVEQPYGILATNDPMQGTQLGLCGIAAPQHYFYIKDGVLPARPSYGPTQSTTVFLPLPDCRLGIDLKVHALARLVSPRLPLDNLRNNRPFYPIDRENLVGAVNDEWAALVKFHPSAIPCDELQQCPTSVDNRFTPVPVSVAGEEIIIAVQEPCALGACQDLTCDADADSIEDGADNCPVTWNEDQANSDDNPLGDACQVDRCFDFVLCSLMRPWLENILPDRRLEDAYRRYPELFPTPRIGDQGPLFPPGIRVLIAESPFYVVWRTYTDRYLNGAFTPDSYREQSASLMHGARIETRDRKLVREPTVFARRDALHLQFQLQSSRSRDRTSVWLPKLMVPRFLEFRESARGVTEIPELVVTRDAGVGNLAASNFLPESELEWSIRLPDDNPAHFIIDINVPRDVRTITVSISAPDDAD